MALFPQYQITISAVYAVDALILVRAGFLFLWKKPRTNPLWALHWARLCSQNKLVKCRTLFSEFVKFFPVKSFLLFQMLRFAWLQLLFSCHMKMPTSLSWDFVESPRRVDTAGLLGCFKHRDCVGSLRGVFMEIHELLQTLSSDNGPYVNLVYFMFCMGRGKWRTGANWELFCYNPNIQIIGQMWICGLSYSGNGLNFPLLCVWVTQTKACAQPATPEPTLPTQSDVFSLQDWFALCNERHNLTASKYGRYVFTLIWPVNQECVNKFGFLFAPFKISQAILSSSGTCRKCNLRRRKLLKAHWWNCSKRISLRSDFS